jgi:hypothetical protein
MHSTDRKGEPEMKDEKFVRTSMVTAALVVALLLLVGVYTVIAGPVPSARLAPVVVVREDEDQVCPQVRVRIWKRGRQTYVPLVLRDFSSS